MSRAAQATINVNALQHNFQRVRQSAADAKIFSIIKADAYGHGILRIGQALTAAIIESKEVESKEVASVNCQTTDGLGVAHIEEAALLRDAGIQTPILLLQGVQDKEELEYAQSNNLQIVIHHESQIALLKQCASTSPKLAVWLKVDTGMHRLGFHYSKLDQIYQQIDALDCVKSVVLMSHFANADDKSNGHTHEQVQCFNRAVMGYENPLSLANSAAILEWPQTQKHIVRPGIMLYGVSPILGKTAHDYHLQAVMSLTTELISVKQLRKGDTIGYGSDWVCPCDMPVGIAAIGYGDGYPRHACNGTPVLVNGERVSLVGRVSMDMICLDLRSVTATQVGDPVILWGDALPVEEVAHHASTIAYELLCGVTQRVKFVEI